MTLVFKPEIGARNKIGAAGSFGERIRNGFFTRNFLKKFGTVL